jgi:hypothetical protein
MDNEKLKGMQGKKEPEFFYIKASCTSAHL